MILAIDQSLTGTGVCFVSRDGVIETHLIKTTADMPWFARMSRITQSLEAIYIKHAKEIEHVFMEAYAYGGSFKGFVLGELGGVIKYHFRCRLNEEVKQIVPAHHKMFITRNGHADKDQVIAALKNNFKIDTANDNIADAVSIALLMREFYLAKEGLVTPTAYVKNLLQRVESNLNGIKKSRRKKPVKSKRRSTKSPEIDPSKDPFNLGGVRPDKQK